MPDPNNNLDDSMTNDEKTFKQIVSKSGLLARKASIVISRKASIAPDQESKIGSLAPYLLAVAIGIHAVNS